MDSATNHQISDKINFEDFVSDVNFLGHGSFGYVYGPWNWENKICALKKRLFDSAVATEQIQSIMTNCTKWMSLSHENLMTVYKVHFERNALYILMEFAGGGSLSRALKVFTNDLPLNVVLNWANQIAHGMNYLHEKSIVHRDLNSANIMIMERIENSRFDGKTLKITDFGQIKEHDHTTELSFVGIVDQMDPDDFVDQTISKASDVWSFGVVVWEILTRKTPYGDMTAPAIMYQVTSGKLQLKIPESCSPSLKSLLQSCWNHDWKERPTFSTIASTMIYDSKESPLS